MNPTLYAAINKLAKSGNPLKAAFGPANATDEQIIEFGKDITPVWGDVRAVNRGINMLENMPKPGDYIQSGQFNQRAYNDAYAGHGAKGVLELASAIPAVGGAAYGLAKLAKNLDSVPRNFGQSGMIAGPKAKTANLDALEQAKSLKADGADADSVYSQTGWWLDHPDGVPRFEIDDSGAQLIDSGLRDFHNESSLVRQGRMMKHDPLAAAYPDTSMIAYRKGSDAGASYTPSSDEIRLPQDAGHPDMSPEMREKAVKSPALHELAHAIQQREGMARGGSPGDFSQVPMDARYATLNKVDVKLNNGIGELVEKAEGFKEILEIKKKYPDAYADYISALSDLGVSKLQDGRSVIFKAYDEADKLSPQAQYRSLAGEAEARLVQNRMDMSMDERLANPFYQGYDVPLEDQIVRFGDGEALQIVDMPAPVHQPNKVSVPIGINPSKGELKEILGDADTFRIIDDPVNKKRYLWRYDDALHNDVGAYFGLNPSQVDEGLVDPADVGITPRRKSLLSDFR